MKLVRKYTLNTSNKLKDIVDHIGDEIELRKLNVPMLNLVIGSPDEYEDHCNSSYGSTFVISNIKNMSKSEIYKWITDNLAENADKPVNIQIDLIEGSEDCSDSKEYQDNTSAENANNIFNFIPEFVSDDNVISYIKENDGISYIREDDFSTDAIDMDNDELTQYVHQTARDHHATTDKMATDVDNHINDLNLWKSKLDSFHELSDHQKANIMSSIIDSIYNALDALANLASEYDERFSDFNQRLFKKFSVLDAYVDGIDERLDDHLDDEEDDTE